MRTYLLACSYFGLYLWSDADDGGTSRTPWRGDEESVEKIKAQGRKNREGYVNVAAQLGLSGLRGKGLLASNSMYVVCKKGLCY